MVLEKFGSATEPRREQGWPDLSGADDVDFRSDGLRQDAGGILACIDKIVRAAVKNELLDETSVVYVSPLKALSNDIQKNLDAPLDEIRALAFERGVEMQEVRTAVRTGDTPMRERQAMLRKAPHILVTTPESLFILLTADKSRQMLASVETVIVDEIYAVADDKRGAHLAVSLERLQRLAKRERLTGLVYRRHKIRSNSSRNFSPAVTQLKPLS